MTQTNQKKKTELNKTGVVVGVALGIAIGAGTGNVGVGVALAIVFAIVFSRKKPEKMPLIKMKNRFELHLVFFKV